MLQNLRDSLKGTFVAGIVILFFVVPLVLTGVGESFLGSALGTDAATVDGKSVSEADLRRAIFQRKQRLLSQEGADPNAEYLKDENLRGPVLENLTQRAAIFVSAQDGGMGLSDITADSQIREIPSFQIDGAFDPQTYRRILETNGYTPASFKAQFVEDVLVSQHTLGINASAFSTDQEVNDLVSLTQQKRSFFTVEVPKSLVEANVTVSEEDIAADYEQNKAGLIEDEKMSVEYIELSVADLASTIEVDEAQVREQYQQELASFEETEEYEIAHLLLEKSDDQTKTVEEVSTKLAAGEDFAELVKQYSDDSGSKDSGGNLGILTPGIFPEAFEQAIYALEEGQVSSPVETDAGIHFIKAVKKTVNKAPTFEERKLAIENAIKTAEAEDLYIQQVETLGELTFSAADLTQAASELAIDIKTTEEFTRAEGSGIATNSDIRSTAFSEEVLGNSYNSPVIRLPGDKAIVLRKAKHTPERIKSLDEVRDEIVESLTAKKIDEELNTLSTALLEKLRAGEEAEAVSKSSEYELKSYDKVQRTGSDAGFQVVGKAFSMTLDNGATAFDFLVDREGNHIVVGLSEVIAGTAGDMQPQQYDGMTAQLTLQNARFENSNYESQVIADADISIK